MVEDPGTAGSPEERLHGAVADWLDGRAGAADLVDAACAALVDGVDSPALRDLAGASARDRADDLTDLALAALDELGVPGPGDVPPGHRVAPGGVAPRPATDVLRLEVVPAVGGVLPGTGRFEVRVHVNGVDVTRAGTGVDPYDLLHPNRLAAGGPVAVTRCGCCLHSCGGTGVTVLRDGDSVHWEWSGEAPSSRGATFAADRYDAEPARVRADHAWETPERTAGRLVLEAVDHDRLRSLGLRATWAAVHHADPDLFRLALETGRHQVFVGTRWLGRTPGEAADDLIDALARPPAEWPATWSARTSPWHEPPAVAGPSWRRDR